MKKVCLFLVVLSLVICAIPVNATENESDSFSKVSCHSIDAANSVMGKEQLVENAKSVFIYEKNSGSLMYAWNADEQFSPASLVKIMTGLIVAENADMEEVITVSEEVLSQVPYGAATSALQVDETLTIKDLFYCLMVTSANDAAIVLANHVLGSQEAFVARMNEYAGELGCTDTVFKNIHGLPTEEDQHTTARDVAKILSAALDNPVFREAFQTEKYAVEPTNKSDVRYLVTGNYLMSMNATMDYYDARVSGGRTGETPDGLRNIAINAELGSLELICVLTGAESKLDSKGYIKVFGGYKEITQLLDQAFENRRVAQVIYDGQVLVQMPVINGDCDVVLGLQTSMLAVLPADSTTTDLIYRYPPESSNLQAPIKKGEKVSSVEIWCETHCVAYADLYALNDVDSVQVEGNTVEIHESRKNSTLLWVLLGIVGALFGVLLLLRLINRIRYHFATRHGRRNRRNRIRSR